MPCFVCDKCGTIDNTALAHYWPAGRIRFKDVPEEMQTMKLCYECIPPYFEDGSSTGAKGQWHNKFPKQHWRTQFETKPNGTF